MSTSYRFPTLDFDDLRSPTFDEEQDNSFKNIRSSEEELGQESGFETKEQNDDENQQLFVILAENRRLARENEALRHCLILTKEHCDLKTANYVTAALAWCDDRLSLYNSDFWSERTHILKESAKRSSAFKPVSPKTTDRGQQTRVPGQKLVAEDWTVRAPSPNLKEKLFAEDWVDENTSVISDPRNLSLVHAKQEKARGIPMASPQPWHMTLRKYSPTNIPRSKSPPKRKSARYGVRSGPYKKSGSPKRSSIPLPIKKVREVSMMDYTGSRQDSFGFSSPSNLRKTSPPRTVLFAEDSYQQRSPSPVKERSPSPVATFMSPPSGLQTPVQTGRYTMSRTSRYSPSPTGRLTPSPASRRTPSPAARRTPSPTERQMTTPAGRQSPSPMGRPYSTGRHSLSPSGRVTPSPAGRKSPSPVARSLSFSVGRHSPSPNGRQSPSPRRSTSPVPAGRPLPFPIGRRSPSPAGIPPPPPPPSGRLTPSQIGSLAPAPLSSRRSPSPTRSLNQSSPAQRSISPPPFSVFMSPMEPLVDKAVRSQLSFSSPTRRATSYNRSRNDASSTLRSASTPPGVRPSTPTTLRASSPWSIVSGTTSTRGDVTGATTRTGAVTLTRSPIPRSPSPGKIRQGSPRDLGIDPLVKIPTPMFTEDKFKNRSVSAENRRTPASSSEDNSNYYSSEGYVSRNYPAPFSSSGTYDMIGQPVATSTPVSREKRARSPRATPISKPNETFQNDSLATLLGISGQGAGEKARGVVYRAVDTLTGYRPNLTPEVKFNLSQAKHNKRIVGEIAFQLDRRILEYVFATNRCKKKNARYYGYSLTNIMQMVYKEAAKAGFHNPRVELDLRTRLDHILRKLAPFGYNLDIHAEKSQDMVNKYGLLNGPPDQNTVKGFGLDDPAVLRIILSKVVRDENELHDMLIMLDCLCYLSYEDGEPIFMW